MALSAGTRVGSYEITDSLGAGGMGEVYRARDTKLDRDVAIKVLPDLFAEDPERLARFQREARTLAALNHPNIATIHGIEESSTVGAGLSRPMHALVMELVEGETLAERIATSAIPIDEALRIAHQIAEALQAAHEQGIIHRDLKPANIKVRPDGTVKVLDFGLAKALEAPAGSSALSMSPTITSPAMATGVGVLLGTAAYMSPEQAKGKPADKRSDIWAFGCVLYEMLTGRHAFQGDDVTETLAAVVLREPDWNALPADLSPAIRVLLRRALERDRRKRLADAAAALVLIEEAPSLASPWAKDGASHELRLVGAGTRRRTALTAAASLAIGGVLVGALVWWVMRPSPPAVVWSEITTSGTAALSIQGNDSGVAITRDGSRVIYRGVNQLLVRALDQLQPSVLSGLGGPRNAFLSPDGDWVGYFDGQNTLKKVAITGGPAVTIAKLDGTTPRGATWGADGHIVYATNLPGTGLRRIPAAGGETTVLTKPNSEGGEREHVWPEFLPMGRGVLFTIMDNTGLENSQVAVFDFATGTYKVVLRGGHDAHYLATGHLVYGAAGTLRAVPFNLDRLEVTGTPVPVLEGVQTAASGAVDAAIAANGTLVYVPGRALPAALRSLVWVTREGREEPIPAPLRAHFTLRLSPDGSRAAIDIRDQENDVWVWDFPRRTLTRLTFAPEVEFFPIWTPDARRVVFTRGGELFARGADGTGVEEKLSSTQANAMSFSPDGKQLIVTYQNDVGVVRLGGKGDITPLVRSMFAEGLGELSPDGQWLAYQSNESGQDQIYVHPFPNVGGGRWQISPSGGTKPVWARNGRELFYLESGGALVTVSIQTQPSFSAGNPNKLFDAPYFSAVNMRSYDATPDGRRFLFIKDTAGAAATDAPSPSIVVVQNWTEELKRLVPVN